MIKSPQLFILIAAALPIFATAQAQSYDQQTIPEAVDQGLYGPNTNRDEKLKDAMFGSNGETYQTHINPLADPVGTKIEGTDAASIGTTNAEAVKCETTRNDSACH